MYRRWKSFIRSWQKRKAAAKTATAEEAITVLKKTII